MRPRNFPINISRWPQRVRVSLEQALKGPEGQGLAAKALPKDKR
jgi:hypothetical protein